MKARFNTAQFKYAFLAGIFIRGPVFAVIMAMNIVFITLGTFGLLPFPAHVTAVSLGGVAIAAMMAVNIIGDISIIRRMYSSPDAYLSSLTPYPRWHLLLAGIVTMAVMDIVTMTAVIASEVWLSFNLAGIGAIWNEVISVIREHPAELIRIGWFVIITLAGYFLMMMIILFAVTARRSFLYTLPARGLLAFLSAALCVYAASLLQLVLIPFGMVERYGLLFIITLGSSGAMAAYAALIFFEAALLFVITARLMERKLNI